MWDESRSGSRPLLVINTNMLGNIRKGQGGPFGHTNILGNRLPRYLGFHKDLTSMKIKYTSNCVRFWKSFEKIFHLTASILIQTALVSEGSNLWDIWNLWFWQTTLRVFIQFGEIQFKWLEVTESESQSTNFLFLR